MTPLTFSEIVAAVEPSIMTSAANHYIAFVAAMEELVRLGFEDRGIPADILHAVVRMTRKEGGCPEHVLSGPISPEWLTAVGIGEYEEASSTPSGAREFTVRIRGGDDMGEKTSSDDDKEGDEISELTIVPDGHGNAGCYVATYEWHERTPNIDKDVISLGLRCSRSDVLLLCRALKAWAIHYPEGF